MDRHLISLVVALVLFNVGPRATVVGVTTPAVLEAALAPHLVAAPLPAGPGVLNDSYCLGHGDVRYDTLDDRRFSYNSPVADYGVMLLPWAGNPWWVMTEHELFGGPPKTRISEVYVKCPVDIYFRATLGSTVSLYYWDAVNAEWVSIAAAGLPGYFPTPAGTAWVSGTAKSITIDCHIVPFVLVSVYRHTVTIHASGQWAAGGPHAVRGICADFNGVPANDCVNLAAPTPAQNWTPFLI